MSARAGVLRALFAACLLSGVVAADAAGATGDLVQKPGAARCIAQGGNLCSVGTALDGAASVALSPDGQNVYVASEGSDAVAVFDRSRNGRLTQKPGAAGCIAQIGGLCSVGTALDGAASVTVSPDGENVYVASSVSDAVAVLDRAADGTLTQKPGAAGCVQELALAPCVGGTALDGASSVAVSPDGQNAYVTSHSLFGGVAVFDRFRNGRLAQKPGAAGCIGDTAFPPCGGGTALRDASSVAVSPDGQSVYVTSDGPLSGVAVLDRAADGTLTQKRGAAGCIWDAGGLPPCRDGTTLEGASSVAVSPDGQDAYIASDISGAVTMFDRSPNGRLTAAACITEPGLNCLGGTALEGASSVAISPDGQSAYVTSDRDILSAVALFDRAPSGSLTQKPGLAGCISGFLITCDSGTGVFGASSVAVSPDGKSAYVASNLSDAVAIFDREDTTNPVLGDLEITPPGFPGARSGPSVAARVGANVSYRLSEAAAVRFTVGRAFRGRRVRGRCVRATRANRRAQRCTRHQTLRGSFTHRSKTGLNSFTFSGRLRARRLQPGRYRLRAVATDPAGNTSRPRRDRFRIIRR